VALVDNDEVEEVWGEFLEEPEPPLVLGEGLVDREIHFAALDRIAAFNLVASVSECREDFILRLIDEDIAIG
jgi:hypothetical protein